MEGKFVDYKEIISDLNDDLIYLTEGFTTQDFLESRKYRDWEKYDSLGRFDPNQFADAKEIVRRFRGTIRQLNIRIDEIKEYNQNRR